MEKPTKTPISDEMLAVEWPLMVTEVHGRLIKGKITYGDPSFSLPAEATCDEILQEISDIMGWGFILRCRVRKLQRILAEREALSAIDTTMHST